MRIHETEHQDQTAWVIETQRGSYTYQPEAGGFSRITCPEGNDWIGFKRGTENSPDAAGGMFRGLPNFVHPDAVGHPGHRNCRSSFDSSAAEARIRTESLDGKWGWNVLFRDTRVDLEMVKVPEGRTYWFLYEGTIGGGYAPAEWFWGTPRGRDFGRKYPGRTIRDHDIIDSPRWIYFGRENRDHVFYIARKTPGNEESTLYFMGTRGNGADDPDGMVVFGFGRKPAGGSVFTGPQGFRIGFLPAEDHDRLARELNRS